MERHALAKVMRKKSLVAWACKRWSIEGLTPGADAPLVTTPDEEKGEFEPT
jgi:hypothetical protein